MNIALLDNDIVFAKTVQEWLNNAGYQVQHFVTGLEFLRNFSNTQYDLCILDWTLPDMEGPDVMVSIKLRASQLPPIMFVTNHDNEADIVRVMESGADDYMVKPPSRQILLARINAIMRRSQQQERVEPIYLFGALKIDISQRTVTLGSADIKLTDKEFDLIAYFLKNIGILLSRAHLLQVVWGASEEAETRKVDVHVSRIRTKLKLKPEFGWRLTSIYQRGYRLERNDV